MAHSQAVGRLFYWKPIVFNFSLSMADDASTAAKVADSIEPDPENAQPHQSGRTAGAGRFFLGLGLGIGLTGLIAAGLHWRTAAGESSAPAPQPTVATGTRVTVAAVTRTPIQQLLKSTGTVAAAELIPVRSPAAGIRVQQILVDRGDLVEQGQVLAVLDVAVLTAQLRQSEAEVKAAEAKLAELQAGSRSEEIERARSAVVTAVAEVKRAEADLQLISDRAERNQRLVDQGAITRDAAADSLTQQRSRRYRLEQTQAELAQAQQRLQELQAGARPETIAQADAQLMAARERAETLRLQLADAQVVAPRAGRIAQRQVQVGDLTAPATPLFSIIEEQALELRLQIPETQVAQVQLQQTVYISSDADPTLRLSGQVQMIDPLVDTQSRMATVEVSLPNRPDLKPGMFLRAEIVTATRTGLTLPSAAVLPQPDGTARVYQLQPDRRVVARSIQLGDPVPNDRVEVKSGLRPSDQVVVKGAAYVNSGDQVEVVQ
jgi:multidrug efflux pump subunit AcrA (membrane-fusion protein)